MSEPTFQAIIEAICVGTPCFTELRLVVDPTQHERGRLGYIDLFFAATKLPFHHSICELKFVSLKGLWNATQYHPSHTDPTQSDVAILHKELKEESEEVMMMRQYCYWDKGLQAWQKVSLQDLKSRAVD
jgi:hypothetical protein